MLFPGMSAQDVGRYIFGSLKRHFALLDGALRLGSLGKDSCGLAEP
jgi:hypothetical protein